MVAVVFEDRQRGNRHAVAFEGRRASRFSRQASHRGRQSHRSYAATAAPIIKGGCMKTFLTSLTISIFIVAFSSTADAQNSGRRQAPDSLKNAPFDPHDLSGIWWGVLPRGANFG